MLISLQRTTLNLPQLLIVFIIRFLFSYLYSHNHINFIKSETMAVLFTVVSPVPSTALACSRCTDVCPIIEHILCFSHVLLLRSLTTNDAHILSLFRKASLYKQPANKLLLKYGMVHLLWDWWSGAKIALYKYSYYSLKLIIAICLPRLTVRWSCEHTVV